MKKILYILLIPCFSFTIISCAAINSTTIAIGALGGTAAYLYKDDIRPWFDDFTKEADETGKTNVQLEKTTTTTSSEKLPSIRFLFVSVGENGTLLTSSDGTKWTKRSSGSKVKLRAVTYGKDTLVAVGFSGTILTSSDGTKWTKRKSRTKNNLGSVTYGNDTFVAVGNSGTILTSSNGNKWTKRKSGTKNSLYGVTSGNNIFLAVGKKGTILTSSDGTKWTKTLGKSRMEVVQ